MRESGVALQVESPLPVVPHDERFVDAIEAVRRIFTQAGFADKVHQVVVEPYRKGSAFLIETLEVS